MHITAIMLRDLRYEALDTGDYALAAICDIALGRSARGTCAIALADARGLTLCKYADAVEGARVVSRAEAIEICREDSGLITVLGVSQAEARNLAIDAWEAAAASIE